MDFNPTITRNITASEVIAQNKVLRNTYLLLSLTLIFTALMSGLAIVTNAAPMNIILIFAVVIGFPFLLNRTRHSAWGLLFTFMYTGFIGWMLGPILNLYIKEFSNGPELIMTAAGSTGLIFLGLSAIALNPKRDFSHWGSFLTIGMIVGIIAVALNAFLFKMPALQIALSVVFSLLSGGLILFQTNQIVRGGEDSYISATVILYVSIINIFMTILQLLGMFSGNRN